MGIDIIFFTDIEDRLSKIYPSMKYVNMPRTAIPLWNKIHNTEGLERIAYGFDTTTKGYSALTISKPYFLNEAKLLYPDYDHYVWIDSGIASHGTVPYEEFLEGVKLGLTDKIRVVQMKYPEPYEREGDYLLRINKGIISASIISVPSHLTDFLWDKTLDAVEHMLSIGSLCLDEHVLAYINGKNMDKFDYWFSDYTVPLNLKYIRMDHNTVIRNLDVCTNHDKHTGCQIARVLLDSIEYVSDFPKDLIPTVLYKIHLMSFYVPEEKHKGIPIHILTGRIMHYIIRNYSLTFPSNVRENLLFSGIDMNDEPVVSMPVLCYTKQL